MRQIRIPMSAAVAVLASAAFFVASGSPVSDAAPAARQEAAAVERGLPYVSTHLYFGTGRHGGQPPISDEEFSKFVADVITPRFPAGLTLQEARGQWRDKDGDINREKSWELTVLYPVAESRARDRDLEHIRTLYCRMYGLESVGRADARVHADF
ncbi:DUF3574 domain-containing protein [Streptomyces sp. NPDC007369]|uniref:DUF3574 domain-containing protein n=1 Tax=Streptomyces sp. NPDC007369 TaxID=3154589 RepID=UPI0033ECF42E